MLVIKKEFKSGKNLELNSKMNTMKGKNKNVSNKAFIQRQIKKRSPHK